MKAFARREHGGVEFVYWARLNNDTIEKGYVYSPEAMSPLVESLDHIPPSLESNQTIFKWIEGNWYLYYVWYD